MSFEDDPICEEDFNSPRAKIASGNNSIERLYTIRNTEDEDEAMTLLVAEAPTSAILAAKALTRVEYNLEHESYGVWRGTVTYNQRNREVTQSQSQYQFETGGGNIHITHSLSTVNKYPAPSTTAPEFYNAIGVSAGGEIAGCDIPSPVFNFSETHVLPASAVDAAYKLALFRATAKVNNSGFKGFAAGEVLFLGAAGSSRGGEEWEINYRFAASENATGLTIGGITGIAKLGWDYLWVYFDDEVSEQTLIKKPRCVVVDRVLQQHNFANIGIGT